jgi:hypothetical protein
LVRVDIREVEVARTARGRAGATRRAVWSPAHMPRFAERDGDGGRPGTGSPISVSRLIVSGSEGRCGAPAALCRVMLQAAPSPSRREWLVKAVGLIGPRLTAFSLMLTKRGGRTPCRGRIRLRK